MPGGMGGGLMGLMRGMGGGMNRGSAPEQAQSIADDYDVARWKRADGLDAAPTMVQAVRADWDQKRAEQQARSPLKRLAGKFSRKKGPTPPPANEPEPRPAGGTIVTPEMKKASQRIHPSAAPSAPPRPAQPQGEAPGERNYLGLEFHTEIGGFFTANPVNSLLLAVDSLGMGALTLNQAAPEPEAPPALTHTSSSGPVDDSQDASDPRADSSYMEEFHKNREQQKYVVRIRP